MGRWSGATGLQERGQGIGIVEVMKISRISHLFLKKSGL